jgi:hypothetical protein
MLMLASSSSSPRHRGSIERGVDGGDHRVIGGLAIEMCGAPTASARAGDEGEGHARTAVNTPGRSATSAV